MTLLVAELLIYFFLHSYYYDTIEQYVTSQLSTVTSFFGSYSSADSADFGSGARQYVENFEDRDKMEVQMLDTEGNVLMTTSGFLPQEDENTEDFQNALQTNRTAVWKGKLTSGEPVLTAVCVLTSRDNENVRLGAVRIIVSLEEANRQLLWLTLLAIAIGLFVFAFVLFSGFYFIRSIIQPVRKIGITARQIALGDFDARIDSPRKNDEIGQLCDTINYMAGELASNERMKNEFISSVSHELRTPLTAIKGWGETISGSLDDPALTKKGLDVIVSESERLSGIVEDLLDFSRLQSGRLSYKMDLCDLSAELSEAVLTLTDTAKKGGVRLDYSPPHELSLIEGDAGRLQQVFVNIIDNAIKYTPDGGTVVIGASEQDGFVTVMISDNGCGIPEDDLVHVKQKFYKAKNSTRGSGIGLAVADEIISSHNGLLEVSSTEHVGTTVTITLPVRQPDNPPRS